MKIVRLFSDDEANTHFDEVDIPFVDTNFIEGAQAIGVSEPWPADRVAIAKLPSGWMDSQHPAPVRQMCVFLGGIVEMTTSDGETRAFKKGDAVLLEDMNSTGHGTHISGAEDALVVLIRLA